MIVEYRCTCGFKTIFPHKYVRHTKSCDIQSQPEKEERGYRSRLAAAWTDAGQRR